MQDVDEALMKRFQVCADGEGEAARVHKKGLRNLLECTDDFCLVKHWLPDEYVDGIYARYAKEDGIGPKELSQLAKDGLLLEGRLQEYEQAFNFVDTDGDGLVTREDIGSLFEKLGRTTSPEELDAIVDAADVGHDGIDLADFLGLARTHLDLGEVLRYVAKHPRPAAELPPMDPNYVPDTPLGEVLLVHSEAELNSVVAAGGDVIVKLAFTWCRPCKAFWPKYRKFAKIYGNTRFVKIVGNENESCKHYACDVLHARISPMFATYSNGVLVSTWTGANNKKFIENIESNLPSAEEMATARDAAVSADSSLAPVERKSR